jgi:hypothetical protein
MNEINDVNEFEKKNQRCGWNWIEKPNDVDEIDKMTECHNMDKFITNGIVIVLAQDVNEIWFLVYNHLNSLKFKKKKKKTKF